MRAADGSSRARRPAAWAGVLMLLGALLPAGTAAGENFRCAPVRRALEEPGSRAGSAAAAPDADGALRFLASADGDTDPRRIAAALDVLRAAEPGEPAVMEALSRLLPYRSPLYRDRDRLVVIRLRAQLMATLAEIGYPASAQPALVDTLAHVDEFTPVLELAAAARAAGSLGAEGRPFLPFLIEAVFLRRSFEEVSLERYDGAFPPEEATTVQLEAVCALGRIARPEDEGVLEALGGLAGEDAHDARLAAVARQAIQEIRRAAAADSLPTPSSGGLP